MADMYCAVEEEEEEADFLLHGLIILEIYIQGWYGVLDKIL